MAFFGINFQSWRCFSQTYLLGLPNILIQVHKSKGPIRNNFIHIQSALAANVNPPPDQYPRLIPSFQFNRWKPLLSRGQYEIIDEEEEEKGGSESNSSMSSGFKLWKMKKQDEEELAGIKEGDFINIPDLFFTNDRDYLVKCNDDQKVTVEQLTGKVILIYFDPIDCNVRPVWEDEWITYLIDIYNHLLPTNNFEVVVVAHDADDDFRQQSPNSLHRSDQKKFEYMPWTAIPLSDLTSRKRIARRFGVSYGTRPEYPEAIPFIVDSQGMVLNCDARLLFEEYGTLGYPFSYERIKFLDSEDAAAIKNPSLEKLLGSPVRDYVISNNGDKVPIHTLEDKVVALYFCEDILHDDEDTIQLMIQLKMAYKELAKNKENFEVVLLYLYNTSNTYSSTTEESFWKTFKTMPWLALPYKDPNVMKLVRLFKYPWTLSDNDAPTLVIFGPHGEFIDPYGAKVLMNFGTPAYPFTRERLFKLESERINALKLEMLWDPNTMFREKNGFEVLPNFFLLGQLISSSSNIQLSQLGGKRLVLFFEIDQLSKYEVAEYAKTLDMLKNRYLQMKGTDDEFEVIHMKESSSSTNEYVGELPWSVHYYGDNGCSVTEDFLYSALCFTYYCGEWSFSYSLLAFDRDGRLVRRTKSPSFKGMDFPFYAGGLDKELWYDLDKTFWLSNRFGSIPICNKSDRNWLELVRSKKVNASDPVLSDASIPSNTVAEHKYGFGFGFGLRVKHVFILWVVSGLWKLSWYVLET